jgi:hypothetical protein
MVNTNQLLSLIEDGFEISTFKKPGEVTVAIIKGEIQVDETDFSGNFENALQEAMDSAQYQIVTAHDNKFREATDLQNLLNKMSKKTNP